MNCELKRMVWVFVVACLASGAAYAQQKVVLDLERTVRLATDSSLTAQKYQSVYDISRYQYLSWIATRKPQISLEATPFLHERYMTQRYLSFEDIDEYRMQQDLYSQAGITITQAMEPWGGEFYGSSKFGYLHTFGEISQNQFMTIPIAVGYRQNLLFYNPWKWAKKIEPLKLSRAEQELSYGIETASEQAVEKFFTLAMAQDGLRMAEKLLASCDTIYAIAERRFNIASISKAELSMLQLDKTNARIALANARIAYTRAMQELATYLGMDRSTYLELEVPDLMQGLRVDTEEALRYARENNPRYMESRQATEEARRDAAKARVEKNLNLSLDVSVGLNQVAYRFVDAYMHPLLQDVAMVTLSVPIVDWGKRKNAYMAALSKVEAAERSEQEAARDTELDVMLTVNDFNEQQTIVEASQEALDIAEDAYNQTLLRFIKAQANTTDLSLAQTNWLTAQQNKIASLQNYWITYYRLRRLTLYDYRQRQVIRYVRK
ncbi:MAG: TolC family protein [Bacteroidales bacterium]|nr:TolC family protein [Bacteroidales bacterium]